MSICKWSTDLVQKGIHGLGSMFCLDPSCFDDDDGDDDDADVNVLFLIKM